MHKFIRIVSTLFFLLICQHQAQASVYWAGNAADPSWSNQANWANGTPALNDVVFNPAYDPENDTSVLFTDLTINNLTLDGWTGDLYLQGNLNILDSFIMKSGRLHIYSQSALSVGNNFIFNGETLDFYNNPIPAPVVPEPASLLLLSLGLLGAGAFKKIMKN